MTEYKVTVTKFVSNEELNEEDLATKVMGTYFVNGTCEEDALDEFHETTPIACLNDFEITIKEVKNA